MADFQLIWRRLIIKKSLVLLRRYKRLWALLRSIKFFLNLVKLPFRAISRFCYRNFLVRDREEALSYIYGCGQLNSVLKTKGEVEESSRNLKKLKLRGHNDRPKNWDCYRAFSFILRHGNEESKIFDVGCGDYGVILPWLELYGLSNLYGCDIALKKDFQRGRIHYYKQNLQKTTFPSIFFDFITSISVIEHGVNLDIYLKEMSRLLKPGGYLLTSTDYWHDPIDTSGLYPYGEKLNEMKIFTRSEIEGLVARARGHGLELIELIDFSCQERVVHWKRVEKEFSFIFFVLRKGDGKP